jgi:hypothetical protein
MTIDIDTEVHIARPRADVAAFMFEPANDRVWTANVIASKKLTDGPLRDGSAVERTVKFLGRTFAYRYDVVAAEDERFVEMKVEKPFPMLVRYELEDAAGGTTARIRARGDGAGFFKMAGPLLAPMVRRSIGKDLVLLKRHLET